MESHLKTSIRILFFVYMLCSSSHFILSFESLPSTTPNLFNSVSLTTFLHLLCHSFGWSGANTCFVAHYIPRACIRKANPFQIFLLFLLNFYYLFYENCYQKYACNKVELFYRLIGGHNR